MSLGNFFRSLFKGRPKQEPAAGWAFIMQANLDLKRQFVYVHIVDEAQAEAAAAKAISGVIVERMGVTADILANLGVPRGQHKVQDANGWSFSFEGPPGGNNPLVFVFLSDEKEAEAAARKVMSGTILNRSEVPPVVLIHDLGIRPGGTKVV
jgi:hypothetical protein